MWMAATMYWVAASWPSCTGVVFAVAVIAVPVAKLTTEAEQMRARMITERDRWAEKRAALTLPKIDSARGLERELLQPARADLAAAKLRLRQTEERVTKVRQRRLVLVQWIRNPARMIWAKHAELNAIAQARKAMKRAEIAVQVRAAWIASPAGQTYVASRRGPQLEQAAEVGAEAGATWNQSTAPLPLQRTTNENLGEGQNVRMRDLEQEQQASGQSSPQPHQTPSINTATEINGAQYSRQQEPSYGREQEEKETAKEEPQTAQDQTKAPYIGISQDAQVQHAPTALAATNDNQRNEPQILPQERGEDRRVFVHEAPIDFEHDGGQRGLVGSTRLTQFAQRAHRARLDRQMRLADAELRQARRRTGPRVRVPQIDHRLQSNGAQRIQFVVRDRTEVTGTPESTGCNDMARRGGDATQVAQVRHAGGDQPSHRAPRTARPLASTWTPRSFTLARKAISSEPSRQQSSTSVSPG